MGAAQERRRDRRVAESDQRPAGLSVSRARASAQIICRERPSQGNLNSEAI